MQRRKIKQRGEKEVFGGGGSCGVCSFRQKGQSVELPKEYNLFQFI